MKITLGSNISSLMAQRSLKESSSALSKAYERLASGMRINHASDDAAGLSIAQSLNTDSRVYTQGVRNLNDGISLLQIAEGTVKALKSVVTRQQELAAQASNGTFSDDQRAAMQKEVTELSLEYNRLLDAAQFNGRSVFGRQGNLVIQAGYGEDGAIGINLQSSRSDSAESIDIISRSSTGELADADSGISNLIQVESADGRYLVFYSDATNLVEGDNNGATDVFMRDRLTGTTERISVSSSGEEGNGASTAAAISADGRYVSFRSTASNLVEGDTNALDDIFVRDLYTGTVERVSVSTSGAQGNDLAAANTISADGRYVFWHSAADNLVAGDSNSDVDVFRHDRLLGTTELVSVNSAGVQGNGQNLVQSITSDGRYLVMTSTSTNLAPGAVSGVGNIFVRDLVTGTTTLVSKNNAGQEGDSDSMGGKIAADGRYITFASEASNLVSDDGNGQRDIFIHDLLTSETRRVNLSTDGAETNAVSNNGDVSADGRYVAFTSSATTLVSDDTNGNSDVFVHDTATGTTVRVNVSDQGQEANSNTWPISISDDGEYVTFWSFATNLVADDDNVAWDLFTTDNPLTSKFDLQRSQWVDVGTQERARSSLEWLSQYLEELNSYQAEVGSAMSRFDVASSNLVNMSENAKVAEGRIRDADIAEEAATLVRQQILQQTGAAILAQANQQPALAIKLLGG